MAAPSRLHSGHVHSHQDNVYLTSTNKKDAGVRITRIGLYVNLGMAISKGIGGYYFNSQALVADAFHALTDLVSDFMTLATISVALRPPSRKFPNGLGKAESLGSLTVSGLLLAGGVLTMRIARERKSSVLASNAVHHRVDSLTSIVALVAIAGSHIFTGASFLDPVGGLIVSLMVIRAGLQNTASAILELLDMGLDDEIKRVIRESAEAALHSETKKSQGPPSQPEAGIRTVQGTKAGQNYLVDVIVAVPNSCTVKQTCQMETAIKVRVGKDVRGVRKVRVKFVPEDQTSSFMDDFVISMNDSKRVEEPQHPYKEKSHPLH
ncbi:hypothetical protein MMC25_002867 [Agyrium rufum]|nr:hypothetical protein [Agyrium rufum]